MMAMESKLYVSMMAMMDDGADVDDADYFDDECDDEDYLRYSSIICPQ